MGFSLCRGNKIILSYLTSCAMHSNNRSKSEELFGGGGGIEAAVPNRELSSLSARPEQEQLWQRINEKWHLYAPSSLCLSVCLSGLPVCLSVCLSGSRFAEIIKAKSK